MGSGLVVARAALVDLLRDGGRRAVLRSYVLRQLRVVREGVAAVRTEERRQRARPFLFRVRRHVAVDAQLGDGAVLAVAALVALHFDLEKKR